MSVFISSSKKQEENVKCFKRLPIFIVEETVNAKFEDFKIHKTEIPVEFQVSVERLSRFLSYFKSVEFHGKVRLWWWIVVKIYFETS